MSKQDFLRPFLWHLYSRKMGTKIENPKCAGWFTAEDAHGRNMHYAFGEGGKRSEGNVVNLYWLVDPTDGIIVDARFQVFGHSALIAAAEAGCEIVIGKNYDQAKRINGELIDRHLRDKSDRPAFPEETLCYINFVLDAIEMAVSQCINLPLPNKYISPVPRDIEGKEGEGYPDWIHLSLEKKLAVIEAVLNEDVRPYVELDEGGIEVRNLINDQELIISYQGACTTCFSSVGATLATIQQIIQTKVHPEIKVIPEL